MVYSFCFFQGGQGGLGWFLFLAKPADFGGADRVPSLFLPHKELKLLQVVIFHQAWGKWDLTHVQHLAVLFIMVHAAGLDSVEYLEVRAKGVSIKSR